jgi:YidC/Oxa1 family membrane protein insertase
MGIFHEVFYRPIFNLLIWLYNVIPGQDIGLAIIALTVIIKLLLWPLTKKALQSQRALARLQPQINELKKKYPAPEQREQMAKEMMGLYAKEKVSPASSCLPLLIQLPVFIALYRALSHGLGSSGFEDLYSFVANPGTVGTTLLGWLDLRVASPVLAILAGAAQFVQARMTITKRQPPAGEPGKDEQMLAMMNKQMLYVMPVLTVVIAWTLPAGLSLYWTLMSVLTVLQQWLYTREHNKTEHVNLPVLPPADGTKV